MRYFILGFLGVMSFSSQAKPSEGLTSEQIHEATQKFPKPR